MAHIQYFRLTPPIPQKEDKGPSAHEIRANARSQVQVCSACGESPAAEQLKNCAGCRVALYCSKKCQVSDWPGHKLSCAKGVSSTDINLKLAKKLMANDDLMFYLMVYSVLALELLTTPNNALHTCLVVKLTTKDADPLAARGAGTPIMLQIAGIEKAPLGSHTTPAMRVSLEKMKASLAGTPELGSCPVVMLVFTSDDTNCLGCRRERNPFVIESALMGKCELPVDEKNIIEMLNNKIYMDKQIDIFFIR
ncbi:hypothetical protein K438DRAFT_1832591 [Mycena galopus ATCC 62051]|nr:hypothetical protein K438DRAFT_1832591 [Mycena galopus ATCC 62051]